jgi:hypothetical protein
VQLGITRERSFSIAQAVAFSETTLSECDELDPARQRIATAGAIVRMR